MRIGSLFSGIGGLELGLEWSGVGETVFQVEADPFCRRVLAKHWPNVKRFNDVREVGSKELPECDVLCGGFPCQDLSSAARGRNNGLSGERSGLWFEYERIISELGPRFVVVESVAGAAAKRWLPFVRRSLWGFGYASLPILLRGSDVGAPFRGDRIFVVATTDSQSKPALSKYAQVEVLQELARHARRDWGSPHPAVWGWLMGFPSGWANKD